MVFQAIRRTGLAAAFTIGALLAASTAEAVELHPPTTCRPRQYVQPDLFYNYYVPPNCGGVGAQMYLCPRPTPPLVGHTYHTYQPLFPHEWLYKHHRAYHTHYNYNRGLSRTRVIWW